MNLAKKADLLLLLITKRYICGHQTHGCHEKQFIQHSNNERKSSHQMRGVDVRGVDVQSWRFQFFERPRQQSKNQKKIRQSHQTLRKLRFF
jgi:hypothetical protein